MLVEIKRTYNCSKYCISHVYVDGLYVCDSVEDTDRGLDQSMPIEEINKIKVYAKTAIPTGKYRVNMNTVSYKFIKKPYYKNFCNGKLPRLESVPGFLGILWHKGEDENSTAGCLIVGYNRIKGKVVDSQKAFEKLYRKLDIANRIGEPIWAIYTRNYKV